MGNLFVVYTPFQLYIAQQIVAQEQLDNCVLMMSYIPGNQQFIDIYEMMAMEGMWEKKIVFENCVFHNCGDNQRMVDARLGFGYIIKNTVVSSNTRNHEFYFYNCEFSNDAELYYNSGNPPYSTLSGTKGGIESDLGNFHFENCKIPGYLRHIVFRDEHPYALVGEWTFSNCQGIGTIPTESSGQQTMKTNTVVNCNNCTGEINFSQSFKSIKNCNFSTRYVGNVYGSFYDDEYNNMPVIIEDSIIDYKVTNTNDKSFFHNPFIQSLIIKRSKIIIKYEL